ncbi:winged helix-turn-helix transcriptional regulator [Nonomuraea insulae]|uniref:Winged helix-turn-helix transcriptional regulator n=1 Tax=Nonomuraea insulae TaxID=1616787 RepID=A0ABW1CNC9_9ACTN
MRRTRFDDWPCSIARTVDLIGDWWTPLVMREAFYGARRFEEFQERLGVSRNVLTQRLERLVAEDLLQRVPYQERPTRHEYRLTDKGRDFFTVLAAMIGWGDRWLAGPEGPPVALRDKVTGEKVRPEVVDATTGLPIDVRRIVASPGPGFPAGHADQIALRAGGDDE